MKQGMTFSIMHSFHTRTQGAAAAASATASELPVQEPRHVRLSTGAQMPILGMGTAAVKSADAIRQALAIGYRHFDCAEFYGNEALVRAPCLLF